MLLLSASLAACHSADTATDSVTGKADTTCGDEPTPIELEPLNTEALDAATDSFNAECGGIGEWCRVDAITAYSYSPCADDSLENIVDPVVSFGVQPTEHFVWGNVIDEDAVLAEQQPFRGSDGQALLEAIDTWVGGYQPTAWVGTFEIECHNCTEHESTAVLVYPDLDQVVVVSGIWGFDS